MSRTEDKASKKHNASKKENSEDLSRNMKFLIYIAVSHCIKILLKSHVSDICLICNKKQKLRNYYKGNTDKGVNINKFT